MEAERGVQKGWKDGGSHRDQRRSRIRKSALEEGAAGGTFRGVRCKPQVMGQISVQRFGGAVAAGGSIRSRALVTAFEQVALLSSRLHSSPLETLVLARSFSSPGHQGLVLK